MGSKIARFRANFVRDAKKIGADISIFFVPCYLYSCLAVVFFMARIIAKINLIETHRNTNQVYVPACDNQGYYRSGTKEKSYFVAEQFLEGEFVKFNSSLPTTGLPRFHELHWHFCWSAEIQYSEPIPSLTFSTQAAHGSFEPGNNGYVNRDHPNTVPQMHMDTLRKSTSVGR